MQYILSLSKVRSNTSNRVSGDGNPYYLLVSDQIRMIAAILWPSQDSNVCPGLGPQPVLLFGPAPCQEGTRMEPYDRVSRRLAKKI